MTDYYVNLAADYNHSAAGTSGDPWGGAIGVERGIDTASSGETIYIAGTADVSKAQTIVYSGLAGGTFSAGDTLTESGAALWSAVVYTDNGATSMRAYVVSGTPTTTQSFDNGAGVSATINGAPTKNGVEWGVANGLATGYVSLIGVNNITTWTDDGTQAVLDANSVAVNCFINTINSNYKYIKNITFKNATSHNVDHKNLSSSYSIYNHCLSENSGSAGFYAYKMGGGLFYKCVTRNNGGSGAYAPYNGTLFVFCVAYNNNGDGLADYYGTGLIGCLAFNNKTSNFSLSRGTVDIMYGCTSDNPATAIGGGNGAIIDISGGLKILIGNRFTNSQAYDVDPSSATYANIFEDYNVFNNARLGTFDGTPQSGGNSDTSPTSDGYTDVRYTIDYNLGVGGTPFSVGETITSDSTSASAVLTAVTDNGATGTLVYNTITGQQFAKYEYFTGSTSTKNARMDTYPVVDGSYMDFNIKDGAEIRSTAVNLWWF